MRPNLRTESLGRSFLMLDECSSTNDVATRLAEEGAPHGFTIIAKEQTLGRGRRGTTWFSPKGGIWMTVILRPPPDFKCPDSLPLLGALGIARAVQTTLSIRVLVRWPNDVMFQNLKFAGVLVETKFTGNALDFVVLGLGVNVNFRSTLINTEIGHVTSLRDISGSEINRSRLISSILEEIENFYERLCFGETSIILERMRENDWSSGRVAVVHFDKGKVTGTFGGYETLTSVRILDEHGRLRLIETGAVSSVEYCGL